MASLSKIVAYADKYLRVASVGDSENALNGLQLENSGGVSRLGASVDVTARVLLAAAERHIDLLVVHHGMFWPGLQPVTVAFRRLINLGFEYDIAIYSAHLPLDVHPVVGNNARLATALGIKGAKPFLEDKGQPVGLKARTTMTRNALNSQLHKAVNGPTRIFPYGPAKARVVGIVTGGAGSEIYRVAAEGIDTFITGEAPHWAAIAAEELGMNLILGGHYATETFGVKALAAHLSRKFSVPWEFIDFPTGL